MGMDEITKKVQKSKNTVRANCLDASAIVKLYSNEDGSDILTEYIKNDPAYYTTPFCYFEALNVLKVKWLYRKEISQEEYRKATFSLTVWFSHVARRVKDIDFTSPTVFRKVQRIANRYKIDLSDAFQILSVKEGYFSHLTGESTTILVTADEKLASAAKKEGIKSWHLLNEPAP